MAIVMLIAGALAVWLLVHFLRTKIWEVQDGSQCNCSHKK